MDPKDIDNIWKEHILKSLSLSKLKPDINFEVFQLSKKLFLHKNCLGSKGRMSVTVKGNH